MGIALFSLTLGVFVTSTVAWFDISNNLVVNTMSLSLGDPDSVQVAFSEDGEYYSELTSDLLEANTAYKKSDAIQPVTSSYQSEWLNSETNFADAVPLFKRGPDSDRQADYGYIQLDLYLKTQYNGYVYLDDTSYVKANMTANAKTAKNENLSEADLNNVPDCMRISFYTEEYGFKIYEPNVSEPSQTRFGGRIDYAPETGYFDYYQDPSNKEYYETFFGEYNKADNPTLYYGPVSDSDSLVTGTVTGFNASTKAGVHPLDVAKSESDGGLKIATEKTYVMSELVAPATGKGVGLPLLYCYADEPKRIVISIYCEGWDLDAVKAVSKASFDMSVVLTATIDQPKMD